MLKRKWPHKSGKGKQETKRWRWGMFGWITARVDEPWWTTAPQWCRPTTKACAQPFQSNRKLRCFTFLHDLGLALLCGLSSGKFIGFPHTSNAEPKQKGQWFEFVIFWCFFLGSKSSPSDYSRWQWKIEGVGYQPPPGKWPIFASFITSQIQIVQDATNHSFWRGDFSFLFFQSNGTTWCGPCHCAPELNTFGKTYEVARRHLGGC